MKIAQSAIWTTGGGTVRYRLVNLTNESGGKHLPR